MTGGEAIVRGNAGRTFANGFLFDDFDSDTDGDGTLDIVALIANQIVAALQSVRNEMYALPYDYDEWDAASADLLERAVELRWHPTPADRPRTVRIVAQCADDTDPTSDSNPGGSSAGELNATIAALTFAGFPASSIATIADSAAVDAAIGTFDVLIFPEQELCTLDGAEWAPVVRRFIHHGGRVVFTTPRGDTAAFASSLGLFGTGSSGGASGPYSIADDRFWTGITHPGSLNSMGSWAWTGPGIESLAVDSASRTTVMRYIYRAP